MLVDVSLFIIRIKKSVFVFFGGGEVDLLSLSLDQVKFYKLAALL